ncbi:unnamed protein product [Cuscuta campestris]|uniref:Uncharacterized protein n=1 Tax=Cuscuta campestris TaxID=132261 RepID=A0A484NH83_9ASTE|nr:unnamed protein product [Cuscuta campestris]
MEPNVGALNASPVLLGPLCHEEMPFVSSCVKIMWDDWWAELCLFSALAQNQSLLFKLELQFDLLLQFSPKNKISDNLG